MTPQIYPRFVLGLIVGLTMSGCQIEDESSLDHESLSATSQGLSLGAVLGHNVASGTTAGQTNAVTPVCATSTAGDMTYEWIAPSNGTFTFTTTGALTNFDTVLQIAEYASPGTILACNNDASTSTTRSTVTLSLASAARVLVEIDGYASLSGTYQLGITKNCPTSCTSPPRCHEPVGTCTVTGTCSYTPLCGLDEVCSRSGVCVPRCLTEPQFPC